MAGTRSDPHRRPLRHTYQEGPGFLFLATRGGRPPGPREREDLAQLRFRIRCVKTANEQGIMAARLYGGAEHLDEQGRTELEPFIESIKTSPLFMNAVLLGPAH